MADFASLYRACPFVPAFYKKGRRAGGSDERCDGINLRVRDIRDQCAFLHWLISLVPPEDINNRRYSRWSLNFFMPFFTYPRKRFFPLRLARSK